MYRHINALMLLVLLCIALSAASGGICFTHEEVAQLERLKRVAIARKKHIEILEKKVEDIRRIAEQGRRERARLVRGMRPCRCFVPWLVTGVTVGACAVGMITVGVVK